MDIFFKKKSYSPKEQERIDEIANQEFKKSLDGYNVDSFWFKAGGGTWRFKRKARIRAINQFKIEQKANKVFPTKNQKLVEQNNTLNNKIEAQNEVIKTQEQKQQEQVNEIETLKTKVQEQENKIESIKQREQEQIEKIQSIKAEMARQNAEKEKANMDKTKNKFRDHFFKEMDAINQEREKDRGIDF